MGNQLAHQVLSEHVVAVLAVASAAERDGRVAAGEVQDDVLAARMFGQEVGHVVHFVVDDQPTVVGSAVLGDVVQRVLGKRRARRSGCGGCGGRGRGQVVLDAERQSHGGAECLGHRHVDGSGGVVVAVLVGRQRPIQGDHY